MISEGRTKARRVAIRLHCEVNQSYLKDRRRDHPFRAEASKFNVCHQVTAKWNDETYPSSKPYARKSLGLRTWERPAIPKVA
jgi:hypothetical protein